MEDQDTKKKSSDDPEDRPLREIVKECAPSAPSFKHRVGKGTKAHKKRVKASQIPIMKQHPKKDEEKEGEINGR